MSIWKPSFIKSNDKYKNLQYNIDWNDNKKNNFFENKKNYKHNENDFPSLGKNNNSKTENKNTEWSNIIKKNVTDENIENIVNTKKKIENKKKRNILWTEEDTKDEHFDILHSDTMLDIHNEIISYCIEKNLPFYNSYDKFYNFIDLVKNTSSEYDNMLNDNIEEEEDQDDEDITDDEFF